MTNNHDIEAAMATLRRSMAGAKERMGEGLQLTRTQIEILMILHTGSQTTGQLAKRLFLTQGAVTQTVETLVQRGLVERQPAAHDRRVTDLVLTEAGQKQTSDIQALRHKFMHNLLAVLTPAETEAFISITQKLSALLDEQAKTND